MDNAAKAMLYKQALIYLHINGMTLIYHSLAQRDRPTPHVQAKEETPQPEELNWKIILFGTKLHRC